jgi:hypothetical protein
MGERNIGPCECCGITCPICSDTSAAAGITFDLPVDSDCDAYSGGYSAPLVTAAVDACLWEDFDAGPGAVNWGASINDLGGGMYDVGAFLLISDGTIETQLNFASDPVADPCGEHELAFVNQTGSSPCSFITAPTATVNIT